MFTIILPCKRLKPKIIYFKETPFSHFLCNLTKELKMNELYPWKIIVVSIKNSTCFLFINDIIPHYHECFK